MNVRRNVFVVVIVVGALILAASLLFAQPGPFGTAAPTAGALFVIFGTIGLVRELRGR